MLKECIGNLADTFKGEAWRRAGFSGERAQVVGRDAVDALRLADAQGRSAIDQALGHDEGWHHVVERRELAVPVLVAYQGQVLGMRVGIADQSVVCDPVEQALACHGAAAVSPHELGTGCQVRAALSFVLEFTRTGRKSVVSGKSVAIGGN